MKEKILSLLKEAPGELSGEELSRTLGVSRAAVWKAIEQLRREGCEIAASTRRGYRLLSAPDTLSAERIGALMGDCPWHTNVIVLESVDSTNNYLKQLARRQASDQVLLGVLTEQVATAASELIWRRYRYLADLNRYAAEAYRAISGQREELRVLYRPSAKEITDKDQPAQIKQKLLDRFAEIADDELRRATTQLGPHRDDLEFQLDGKNAHLFASQGQQRTIALSLKLAEIQLIKQLTGEEPILLLDDVMSELDQNRQAALLNFIHGQTQTFITTTDLDGISQEIVKQPRIFYIHSGQIIEKEEGLNGRRR